MTSYVTVQSDKALQAKKNFNRFSVFVKSGGESYILGTSKVHVPEGEKVYIMVRNISLDNFGLIIIDNIFQPYVKNLSYVVTEI
jgi:hypothetical protein